MMEINKIIACVQLEVQRLTSEPIATVTVIARREVELERQLWFLARPFTLSSPA